MCRESAYEVKVTANSIAQTHILSHIHDGRRQTNINIATAGMVCNSG